MSSKISKTGKFGRGNHLIEYIDQYLVRLLQLVHKNNLENEEE
jgi:hypothetical protein